jgi:hypothetical protein
MKRYAISVVLLTLAALVLLFPPHHFLAGGGSNAQRRPGGQPARPGATAPSGKDYSKFSHSTKEHTEACNTCHKLPTGNWKKVRNFPDVTDFPDHNACVRCHRNQFFKGAQPQICTVCHLKSSAKDDTRFAFRNPARLQQFKINFPHDKHQDVIAALPMPPGKHSSRSPFIKAAHPAQQAQQRYYNCEICHPRDPNPVAPKEGWTDGYVPPPDTYKASPANHAACFNCHWSGQEPTREKCEKCHEKAGTPHSPQAPKRLSVKFRHDAGQAEGNPEKNHPAECTVCHINITKSASLQGLKIDVPIFPGCTNGCHKAKLVDELFNFNKGNFKCSKCHTSDVGAKKPPPSHMLAAAVQ